MNLRRLLFIQGIATSATFLLILFKPAAIPNSFGIPVSKENYALPLLIGANELALSWLSFTALNLKENNTLKKISGFFIVFHFATAFMCAVGIYYGTSAKIIANIIFRLIMVALFYFYGIYKLNQTKNG